MPKKEKSPSDEDEEEPTPPLDLAAARLVKTTAVFAGYFFRRTVIIK